MFLPPGFIRCIIRKNRLLRLWRVAFWRWAFACPLLLRPPLRRRFPPTPLVRVNGRCFAATRP